ncbi:DNA-directed RNA polymerase I subunit RPA12 [Strongylocentrotus purpuratus]|uniref:DNA-directed RNA polymerase subunit n=1 Tax=Strongylocentrotus purpuratus TaxID=7668 RepID=A0A7M7GFP6_STRPU|nr:DNA-directed RNA polymerase I subunit RPA12 [Strongylocentrotus purpuratus]|eukprot:XP_003723788.1 PREDICTED: DNA-directed RNA polymerase I subunit RPA12 [Strongylocentrotus purpuratus]
MDADTTFSVAKEFCPRCGTILPFPERGSLDVYCKKCSYQTSATDTWADVVYHSHRKMNERRTRKTERGHPSEDLGPVVDRACSHCGHDGLHYHTRQTRSADEGQTVFYFCPSCKKQEIEHS